MTVVFDPVAVDVEVGAVRAPRTAQERLTKVPGRGFPELAQRAVSAAELVERHHRDPSLLTAKGLERWLVRRQLAAVDDDGLLHPTELGLELSAGLAAWAG